MNSGNEYRTRLPRSIEFEQLYVNLRCSEKRIYTDEEVAWLPDVPKDNIHRKEWEIRKLSCKKLVRYLRNKKKPLKILEVGCGNGWLSYQLSQPPHFNVVGLDMNLLELQQAERVFTAIPNLQFVYGDIHSDVIKDHEFDIIVFASSIQYFQTLAGIIETAFTHLRERGEIHIIDSHFYSEDELKAAEKRSYQYFHDKGLDKMQQFYFHHALTQLKAFQYKVLFDPNRIFNKVFKKKRPFHWICIKK